MLKRREFRRARVHRDIQIEPLESGRRSRWLFSGALTGPVPGRMLDLGVGGMSAECTAKLPIGTPLEIRIRGASGKVQRTRGTIRNVRGDNGSKTLGISFTEPMVALGNPDRQGKPIGLDGSRPVALVVDDDDGVRHVLKRFLRNRGMEVMATSSAEDALDVLRTREPALMMVDLRMDGMTGVQLLETMTVENLRVPNIWAMSGTVSDEEALAALSMGAGEFFNKPFDLDHLDYSLKLLSPML